MDIIRNIRERLHEHFNPPIEDIIWRYSTAGRTENLTSEQIEELYALIDSFAKEDTEEGRDKNDTERKRGNKAQR